LAGYLSEKPFNAGIYLTRKWFESNMLIPKMPDSKKIFKSFAEPGYQVDELYLEQGRSMSIVKGEKTFKGKIYVLTDQKTSKVAETLVYILKDKKIATIVGQKTAGAAMLAEHIMINNEYEIYLPVADFYTAEGKSINKMGIEPDIKMPADDAMKYVLKTL